MLVSEKTYPAGTVVSVVCAPDGGVSVRVHTTRPIPHWLHGKREDVKIEEELLNLIKEQPGRAYSYYTRLPLSQGGIKGSQERKEKIMNKFIENNVVKLVELDKPVGRIKQVINLV